MAKQVLVRMALEPQWEAKFGPNVYGGRIGRGVHDAIEAIWMHLNVYPKYAMILNLEQSIATINPQILLDKFETFPVLRRQLKSWVSSGIIDRSVFKPVEHSSPEKGVLAPLLVNVALHGIEHLVDQVPIKGNDKRSMGCINYGYEIVVIHPQLEWIQKAQEEVTKWLIGLGVKLEPEMVKICHTGVSHNEFHLGFDFLGFHIRNYRVNFYKSARTKSGPTGWKLLIKPSSMSVKTHLRSLKEFVRKHRWAKQSDLIGVLAPQIVMWTKYFKTKVAKRTFTLCDMRLWHILKKWAQKRHRGRSVTIRYQYWNKIKGNNWAFSAGSIKLPTHQEMAIERYTKVKGTKSPYDGDVSYWIKRLQNHPLNKVESVKLLKRQKGLCTWCSQLFRVNDRWEVDHIVPLSKNGPNVLSNKQLLHSYCHDTKTAKES